MRITLHWGLLLLWLGVVARVSVFLVLDPINNDGQGHLEHVKYIAQQHAIPLASYGGQTYHPPLYYLLAAGIWSMWPSTKAVQFLSLILSLATLWLSYRLVLHTNVIPSATARLYAFSLVSLLPQFVLFGLYLSNDTLAMFLGVLVMHRLWRFLCAPRRLNWVLLAVAAGAGLLTKGVFLPLVPIFAVVVGARLAWHQGAWRGVLVALSFIVVVTLVGGYKYAESATHFGNPWISNLDFNHSWVAQQKGTIQGPSFFVDVNILELVRSPTPVKVKPPHSFPLMLYATFWYQHIAESSFIGNRCAPTKYIGSLIYLAAVVPTLTFFVGGLVLTQRLVCRSRPAVSLHGMLAATAVTFFLSSILVLLIVVVRHDVWSVLQARLLFPALFGGLVLFGYGVSVAERQWHVRCLLGGSMLILGSLNGLYLMSEVGMQVGSTFDTSIAGWLNACARRHA